MKRFISVRSQLIKNLPKIFSMSALSGLWWALLKRWWRISVPMRLRQRGLTIGEGVTFYGMPIISIKHGSKIFIGERVVLTSHDAFTALGVARPCILRTLRADARISIGQDTGLSGVVICSADTVKIGKQCLFGADVLVADTDFHPLAPTNRRFEKLDKVFAAPVVIGDNVFIGTRSMILKGVTIGADSVIGAGSLVVSDIPSGVVAGGVPARVLRAIE